MTDDTEWTCADCDHVQRGHRFHCEKCGHDFGTVAAAEVGEPYVTQPGDPSYDGAAAYEAYQKAMDYCDDATIERCAQVAEQYAKKHFATNPEGLAAAIRALKDR